MREFKVNEFISLKLEDDKTNIYVRNKLFRQCKSVLLNIPMENIEDFNDIQSIDDAVAKLHKTPAGIHSPNITDVSIPPEIEFWGHCSNIQSWSEHNYDTNILDYHLSFPLLKELALSGDIVAKEKFKSEIVRRIDVEHERVVYFFLSNNYLSYFNREEKSVLWELIFEKLSLSLKELCQSDGLINHITVFFALENIIRYHKRQSKKAYSMLRTTLKIIFEKEYQESIQHLIDKDYFRNYFGSNELLSMILESSSPITQKLLHLFDRAPQFKDIFDEKIGKYIYIDQKRKRLTGEHWYAASEYIQEIMLLTMEPGFHGLFDKFGKKSRKDFPDWLSYLE